MQNNDTETEFLIGDLEEELTDDLLSSGIQRGHVTITIPRNSICHVLQSLRDHSNLHFKTMIDRRLWITR